MRNLLIFILFISTLMVNAQEQKEMLQIESFVTNEKIKFRLRPNSKPQFDLYKTKGIRITRKSDNSEKEEVILKLLAPYSIADTVNWKTFYRINEERMAFVYSSLYSDNNWDTKIDSIKKKENMLFDLLLLQCDLDLNSAKACGLFFTDSILSKNSEYTYKFYIYTKDSTVNFLQSYKVNSSNLSENKPITQLNGKLKKHQCHLKWNIDSINNKYSGYNVEFSFDNKNFKRLNKAPIISITNQFEPIKSFIEYNHKLQDTTCSIYYRYFGINFFGELSPPSNTISFNIGPQLHSQPQIDTLLVIKNQNIKIVWNMADKKENSKVKNFTLLVSEKDNGSYEPVYIGSNNYFIDSPEYANNYYKVLAISYNGDTLESFSRLGLIIDTIPPKPPIIISYQTDSIGNTIINWQRNTESDLLGYKLFTANHPNEEFVQIHDSIIKSSYYKCKINLKTLSKYRYFKLVAVDNNYNASGFSELLYVKIKDTISPEKPVLISVSSKLNGVLCQFIPSQSEDLLFQKIIRQNKDKNTDTIFVFNPTLHDSTFLDTTIAQGNTYTYFIFAGDSSGNIVFSNKIPIYHETGFRKEIQFFKAIVNRDNRVVNLEWSMPDEKVDRFIIYRSSKNQPLQILKTIEGNENFYQDNNINIGNTYEYRIKALLENGTETKISNNKIVEY